MPVPDDRSWRERWAHSWRSPRSLTALLPAAEGLSVRQLRHGLAAREHDILDVLSKVERLHALRIVVVPPDHGHGPRLLLNSMSDDEYPDHVERLADVLAPRLTPFVASNKAPFTEVLQRHRLADDTVYLASNGVSLAQIRREARLHQVLREWVEHARRNPKWSDMTTEQVRTAARRYVQSLGDPECAGEPAPATDGGWRRLVDLGATLSGFPLLGVLGKDISVAIGRIPDPVRRALATAAAGVWWIYAAPFTALALLVVRIRELVEPDVPTPPTSDTKLDHIEAVEDGRTKNELTLWFPVKPDPVGRALMGLVLYGSERGVRHLWTAGRLAGAQNIHFARLVRVDQGRTMVFMSDYEGSFDAYIDHFIGVGGHTRAVVPISSRVEGCPKTRWLYWPRDVLEFRRRWRALARTHQLQASIRYVAYPELSANDILRNRAVRDGLFAPSLTPAQLADWAAKI